MNVAARRERRGSAQFAKYRIRDGAQMIQQPTLIRDRVEMSEAISWAKTMLIRSATYYPDEQHILAIRRGTCDRDLAPRSPITSLSKFGAHPEPGEGPAL